MLGGCHNCESSEGFDVDKKSVITESSTKQKKLSGKTVDEQIRKYIVDNPRKKVVSRSYCSWKGGNFGCISCQREIALCAIKLKVVNLLYFAKRWQINSIPFFR